jgi:L-histidine Nalpha-methyltransferase
MSASYQVLKEVDQNRNRLKEAFALDVLIGLWEMPKRVPSKYFYDASGSVLFKKIMELPEYYLTRCEFEIFETWKKEISQVVSGEPFHLVELGPGDARKTKVLIDFFLDAGLEFKYVPIDISESAMKELIGSLRGEFPSLTVHGLVSGYSDAIKWLKSLDARKNFVLFLGSNIGNFNRSAARVFLRSLWNTLNPEDYLLIGFDLKKDIDLLLRAYNDSQNVTCEFNLNLLHRINEELGGDFDVSRFRHYANYDVFSGAMESYLVSLEKQKVFIQEIGQCFSFEPWEPIHTEYSYKYLETDIPLLAQESGFESVRQFYDSNHYFTDCIWRVQKSEGKE